ncbi:hypothetical protein ASG58_20390 [Rhizobium sp. Leaf383]|nr:hypothetical protein ASG58_20390 [Rhizobium sp. Leaf383]
MDYRIGVLSQHFPKAFPHRLLQFTRLFLAVGTVRVHAGVTEPLTLPADAVLHEQRRKPNRRSLFGIVSDLVVAKAV